MKKLVILWVGAVIFVFCIAGTPTLNVYAQQAGTQNTRMMAERRTLGQQRQGLQQRIQGYRQQEQPLHYNMGGKGKSRIGDSRPQRSANRFVFHRKP